MDFNLILLLAGLGLLAIVALNALLGFFGGLKRELTCIAVFIVLLVLTWLVFGDAATLLNAKVGQSVAGMLGINDSSIVTLWDAIVEYAKTIIPNGESLLVEGKETYTLFLSICSAVCRAAGLIVGTLAVLIICPIIRFITFIVRLIIKKVKANKAKAKEEQVEKVEETTEEEAPAQEAEEEKATDMVVATEGSASEEEGEKVVVDHDADGDEAIVTKDENEIEKKPTRRPILGAVLGGIKALFIVVLVCAPLAGVSKIVTTVSDDTKELLSDVVNGEAQIELSESTDPVDMVFDFVDAYEGSALGKFENLSAFFFKKSFSERLFDQMLKVETDDQIIHLSDELCVFIEAINALEGNTNLANLSKEQFANALNALKDSELIVEIMPVIIEYVAALESVEEMLGSENVAFLDLRYIDWNKDIETFLDAVIEAYDLGLFPIAELNYLTLDAEELKDVVEILGQAELMKEAYPLLVKVAFNLKALQDMVGDITSKIDVEELDIATELLALVDIYAKFQELDITSLENLDTNALISDILNDEEKTQVLLDIVNSLLDLQVAKNVAVPAIFGFVQTNEKVSSMLEEAGQLENVLALEESFTLEDVKAYAEVLVGALDLVDLSAFPEIELDYLTLDPEKLEEVVDGLFEVELTQEVVDIAVAIVLQMEAVKELLGEVTLDNVEWEKELKDIIAIYDTFQDLGITSLENLDTNALISDILNDESKTETVFDIVEAALSLQVADAIVVPFIFDFASENESLKQMLEEAGQYENFVQLEEQFSVEVLQQYVDVVKDALDLVDFTNYPEIKVDYLHLDPDQLDAIINGLFEVEPTQELIAIFAEVALNLEGIQNALGDALADVTLEGVDWESELTLLVDIYRDFLELGFESLDDLKQDPVEIVESIVADETKVDALDRILDKLVEAQAFSTVVVPVVQHFIDKTLADADLVEFEGIIDVTEVTEEEWKEDVHTIVDILVNVYDLGILDNLNPFDFAKLDITSEEGNAILKELISHIFDLNILGDNETKTEILVATIEKFEWTTLSDDFDSSVIVWDNEEQVILDLVDLIKQIDELEEFDIHDLANTDWMALLNDEDDVFVDHLVTALEVLVESDIFLEVLPGIIDKHLLPKINLGDDFDDSEIIKDILDKFDDNSLGSKELVDEIIKLVEIVKAVVELNLLDAKEEGLGAIDYANTEALKTIVNVIFDSKFIEGNEGRIIRILLKMTGVLDIEKGSDLYNELVSIDYTGEQEILNAFIDEIAPVLQAEDFSIVDQDGKLILTVDFWTRDENARALLNAIDTLFGAYEDENAKGSVLVATLLPTLYDKYVEAANLIPEDFQEIVDMLDVTNASGESLMHDISCLTYIVDLLVEMQALNLVNNGDFNISSDRSAEIMCEIIDVLYDINLFKGNETATVEWVVNYALEKLNIEIDLNDELDSITSEDWLVQKEQFKAVILDVVALLNNNDAAPNEYHIYTYKELIKFIEDQGYLSEKFIQPNTIKEITSLLRDIIDIKVFNVVLPVIVKEVVYMVEDLGYNFTYVFDVLSDGKVYEEFILEDLHKVLDIVDFAVDELNACEYVNNGFAGDLELPNVEAVQDLLDMIFDLTLISKSYGQIATQLYEKFIPSLIGDNDEIVSIEDFQFHDVDWTNELEVLKDLVVVVYDLLDAMNIVTIDDLLVAIEKQYYLEPNMIREEVVAVAGDALRAISKSQILENVIDDLYNYGIFQIASMENLPFALEYLRDVPAELLLEDVATLADILDKVVATGVLEFIVDGNITDLDMEPVAVVVESLYDLNIIKVNEQELFYNLYNYVFEQLSNILNYEFVVTEENIASLNIQQEFVNIANIVRELDTLLDARFITDLNGLLDLVKEKQFAEKSFYEDERTVSALIDIFAVATELQLVDLITPQLIDYAVELAGNNGIDIKFLDNNVYPSVIYDDVLIVLNAVAENLNDSGLLDLIFDGDAKPLVNDALINILDCLPELYLMKAHSNDLFATIVKVLYQGLGIEKNVLPSQFNSVDVEQEIETIKDILLAAQSILDTKEINSINSIKAYIDGKFYLEKDVLDDVCEDVQNLLNSVLDLQIIELTITDIFNYYIEKVDFADINSLSGQLTAAQLLSDIRTVVGLLDEVVETGLLAVVFGADISEINLELALYMDILDQIKDLNVVNLEWDKVAAFLANTVLKALDSDVEYTEADFEGVKFSKDLETIKNLIPEVDALIVELVGADEYSIKDITTALEDVKVTSLLVEKALNVADEAIEIDFLQVILGGIVNGVANKVELVDFLADDTDSEVILGDVRTILSALRKVVDADILENVFANNINGIVLDFDLIASVLTDVANIELIDNNWEHIAPKLTESLMNMVKSDFVYDSSSFADISFAENVMKIVNIVPDIKLLVVEITGKGVNTIGEVIEATKDLQLTTPIVRAALNIADELIEVDFVQTVLPGVVHGLIKDIEMLDFLEDDLDKDLLVKDVKTLLSAARILLDAEVIGSVLDGGINGLLLDFAAFQAALTEVSKLAIVSNNWDHISALASEFIMKAVKSDAIYGASAFDAATFEADITKIINLLPEVDTLVDLIVGTETNTLGDLLEAVKDIPLTTPVLTAALDVADEVIEIEFVQIILHGVVDGLVSQIEALDFLKDYVYSGTLLEDVRTILAAARVLVEAEIVEPALNKEIDNIPLDYDALTEALEYVSQVVILESTWKYIAPLLSKALMKNVQSDIEYGSDAFEGISFSENIMKIANVLPEVEVLVAEITGKVNNKVGDVKAAVKDLELSSAILEALLNVADEVVEIDFFRTVLGGVVNGLVSRYDQLSFLEDDTDSASLTQDVKYILAAIRVLLEAQVFDYLFAGNIDELPLDFDAYEEALSILKNVAILDNNWNDFVNLGVDKALDKLGADIEVDYVKKARNSYTTAIDYQDDMNAIIAVLNEVEELLAAFGNANTVAQVIDNIKNIKTLEFCYRDAIEEVLDVIEAILEIEFILPLYEGLVQIAGKKVSPIQTVFGGFDSYEIASDLESLTVIAHTILDYGTVEFLFSDGSVDVSPAGAAVVNGVIDALADLNIVEGRETMLAEGVLRKVGIESITLDGFDWEQEIDEIQDIVVAVYALLENNYIDSKADVKEFIKFKADNPLDEFIENNVDLIVALIDEVVDSKIVLASLPLAVKFVLNKVLDGKLAFLMDNVTGEELIEDVETIASILKPLVDSDLHTVLFGTKVEELVFDFDNYLLVLDGVQDLNIINNNWDQLGVYAVAVADKVLKVTNDVTAEDFADISFAEDMQDIIDAIEILAVICEHLDINCINDVKGVIENWKDVEVLNTLLTNQIFDAIALINSVESLQLVYPGIAERVANFAKSKGVNIDSVFEGLTAQQLAEDADTVINALDTALVEYGLFGFLFMDKTLGDKDLSVLTSTIYSLAELNILSENRCADIIEAVLAKFGYADQLELELIQGKDYEADKLNDIVYSVASLLSYKDVKSVKALNDLIHNKEHLSAAFYDAQTGELIENIIVDITESGFVRAILPAVVKYGLNKLNMESLQYIDDLTSDQLTSDIVAFASAIEYVIESNILSLVFGGNAADFDINFEAISNIITCIENTYILNGGYEVLVPVGLNFILNKVGSDYRVDFAEFEGISFAADAEAGKVVLANMEKVCDILNAYNVNDIIAVLKDYKDITVLYDETVSSIIDIFGAIFSIDTLQRSLPAVGYIGSAIIMDKKGVDFEFLFEGQTGETLTADAFAIGAMLNAIIDSGLFNYLFLGGEYDFVNDEPIVNIVATIAGLNVAQGNEAKCFEILCNKFGIDAPVADLEAIDWEQESLSLQALLAELCKLPVMLNATYVDELYKIDVKSLLYVTQTTNDLLQIFANVFENLGEDQLINAMILPVTQKFFANPGKFAGLLDLHNIYEDADQLSADLLAISSALNHLIDLDMFGFLNGFIDFPFGEREHITGIITDLLTLNYFNLGEARFAEIFNAVTGLIGIDLSFVDTTKVDLASDAELLVAMYDELATILTHEDWLVVDISEVVPFRIKASLLKDYALIENFFDALSNLVNTTIYTELSGLSYLALPLIEKAASDVYNVLGLYDTDYEEMHHECLIIADIINELASIEVVEMHKTYDFFTKEYRDVHINILDKLDESTILSDHINDLVEYVVEKVLYGKTFGSVTLGYDFLDIQAIDFAADKEALVEIIELAFDFLCYENACEIDDLVYGLHDLNDYIYSMTKNWYAYFEDENRYIFYEEIINILVNTSLLQTNGLAVMNNIVTPMLKGDIVPLLDFSAWTNEEFAADLTSIGELITQVRELGLYTIIRDEMIDYDQADEVKALFNNIAELNYLDHNLDAVIDFVDSTGKVPFALAGLKSADFDHEYDIKLLGTIYEQLVPILLEDGYVFVKRSIYQDFYSNKHNNITTIYDLAIEYRYTLVEVYENIVTMTALPLVFQDVMTFVETKLPEKAAKIVNAMNINSLTPAQIRDDLYVTADMVRTLVDLEFYDVIQTGEFFWYEELESTLTGTPVTMQAIDMVEMLIDQLHSLNLLGNRAAITTTILEILGVDVTAIDLEQFNEADWDAEVEVLKTILREFTAFVAPYGIHSVGELTHYFTQVLGNMNQDKFVKEIQAMYHMLDFAHLANVFEALGDSQVLDEIFVPTYMQLAHPKLPSDLSDLLDLSVYTQAQFSEDMYLLSNVFNSIAVIRERDLVLAGEMKESPEDTITIEALGDALESLLSLNILTVKKVELLAFIDSKVGADLSGIDANNIDLKADAVLLGDLADHILYVFCATNYFEDFKQYYYLGDTKLMTHVIELYKGLTGLSLTKEVSYWAVDTYGNKVDKIITNIDTYTEADIDLLLANIGITLDGMLEMGVFSNNKIDCTNTDTAATDKFFTAFEYAFANRTRVMEHINKLHTNVALFGIIPINYADIVLDEEHAALDEFIKVVKELVADYKDQFAADFTPLADPNFQAALINTINVGFNSKLVNQLLVPIANGLIKTYTVERVQLNILDGVDNDAFVNKFLPDMFQIMDALYPIGALEKQFNYNDADLLIDLFASIVYNDSTINHLGDIVKYLLTYANIDIKDADLSHINWEDEFLVVEAALLALKDELLVLNVKTPSTYQNNDFITAFAVACTHLENSKLLPVVMRPVLSELVSVGFGSAYDSYINRIYDASYTDELMMQDFAKVDEILVCLVATNIYNGGLSSNDLDAYVQLFELVINLHLANGLEAEMIDAVLSITPVFADYAVDYSLVTDWSVEKVAFVTVLEEVSALFKEVDLTNLTEADLNNPVVQIRFVELVDAMSKSVIGQQILPSVYNDKVSGLLGADYQDIIDFSDPTFTPDMWADEFAKLFELNDALVAGGFNSTLTMTLAEAIDVIEMLFGPSMAEAELGIYTATKDDAAYEKWITRLYDHDLVKVGDNIEYSVAAVEANVALGYTWKEEAYKIMAFMEASKPFVNSAGKFHLDTLFASTDAYALDIALEAMRDVYGLRGGLYQLVQDTPTAVKDALTLAGFLDSTYLAELASWQSDETYFGVFWTDEKLLELAEAIANN